MKKKYLLLFYSIFLLCTHQLLFTQTIGETRGKKTGETSTPAKLSIEETVKEINESLGLGDTKKIIVFPILNNEPVFASLIAKNLLSKLKKQNIEKTTNKYLFGTEISRKNKIDTILETYKEQEKYSIAVVVQILEKTESETDTVYTIETKVYRNIANELVIQTQLQGTRDSILGIQNTSLLDDLETIVAELKQQSSVPDDVSLIYLTPQNGDLQKYTITIDKTTLITNDINKGVAYFPSGKHTLRIYQINTTNANKDASQNIGRQEKILVAKIKTKRKTKTYDKTVAFIDPSVINERRSIPLDIALLVGYQRPFLSGGNTTLENGSFIMELQTNIDVSSIPRRYIPDIDISSLPLYFGLSLSYTPVDNINSITSALPNFFGDETDTRQMIAPLLRAGYKRAIIREQFIISAGIKGGALFYSLPYSENAPFSSSLLPTLGLETNFIQYLTPTYKRPRLYLVEQIAVLYTDLKHATLTNVTTSQGVDYIKENESYFYLLPSISLGLGLEF